MGLTWCPPWTASMRCVFRPTVIRPYTAEAAAGSRPWSRNRGQIAFMAARSSSCATMPERQQLLLEPVRSQDRAVAHAPVRRLDRRADIKNRTFVFGLYERNINNAGAFSLFSVPTPLSGGETSRRYTRRREYRRRSTILSALFLIRTGPASSYDRLSPATSSRRAAWIRWE